MFSVIEVKAVDEDQRILRGTATTPSPDRMGDIVEPLGIRYRNPLPLLWQHNASSPVGQAKFFKPTKDGVDFEAEILELDEPGELKNRLDLAWQSVKAKLVRGVSIGFRAIETAFMDNGGMHFLETEVLELSLVTIPANAEATIHTVKGFDAVQRGAVRLIRIDKIERLTLLHKGAVRLSAKQ